MNNLKSWIDSSFGFNDIRDDCPTKAKPNSKTRSCGEKRKRPAARKKHEENSAWCQTYLPQTKDDLAVHKKKISDVEDWLRQSFSAFQTNQFRRQSLLLLTGPAGSGKTATVRVLAKVLNASISEWSSTVNDATPNVFIEGKYQFPNSRLESTSENQTSKFQDFLLRANKYSSLFATESNRITLVEEFPNIFLMNPSSFHSLLRNFSKMTRSPAVFIISDCTSGDSVENVLFPKDLQSELAIGNISFNPVSHTLLLKAIKRVCSLQSIILSKEDTDNISKDCMGDVRSAINTLQFLNTGNVTKSVSQSRRTGLQKDTPRECERDSSLFLFHALGKILYCKRETENPRDDDKLPAHLAHLGRHPLVANPEEVFEKTTISADGFSLFLHENYSHFVVDMEHAANCSAYFSEVDSLCTDWSGRDVLNGYASSIVSRGLMFHSKPNPTGSHWCPLRKPQYYNIMKNYRNSSKMLKNTFRETSLSSKELQTELVPYLCKIGTSSLNPEQARAVRKFGQLSTKLNLFRPPQDSLSTKDVIKESSESHAEDIPFDAPSHSRDSYSQNYEEFIIEDFDEIKK